MTILVFFHLHLLFSLLFSIRTFIFRIFFPARAFYLKITQIKAVSAEIVCFYFGFVTQSGSFSSTSLLTPQHLTAIFIYHLALHALIGKYSLVKHECT